MQITGHLICPVTIRRPEHSRSDRQTFEHALLARRLALDGGEDQPLPWRIDQPKGAYDDDKYRQQFYSDDEVLFH